MRIKFTYHVGGRILALTTLKNILVIARHILCIDVRGIDWSSKYRIQFKLEHFFSLKCLQTKYPKRVKSIFDLLVLVTHRILESQRIDPFSIYNPTNLDV